MRYVNLLIFILLSITIHAQEYTEKRIRSKDQSFLSIESDGYRTEYFVVEDANAFVTIEKEIWESLPSGYIPKQLPLKDQLEIFKGKERRRAKLAVKVPSLRINMEGKYEYLKDYELLVKENNVPKILSRPTYPTNSVLSSGKWYKIGVVQGGIHKIDGTFLSSLGINLSTINPANIRVYGNGGQTMTEMPDDSEPSDLQENRIFVSTSGSNFSADDYILFYAPGLKKWSHSEGNHFIHTNNYYSDTAFYFINIDKGPGKRIAINPALGSPVTTFKEFNDYAVVDIDSFYLSSAGKIWWSHRMYSHVASTLNQSVTISMVDPLGPIQIEAQVGSTVPSSGSRMQLSLNDANIGSVGFRGFADYDDVIIVDTIINANLTTKNAKIGFKYIPSGPGSGAIDYVRINGLSHINMLGRNKLSFRNVLSSSFDGQVVEYEIKNVNASTQIWDVTDHLNPVKIPITISGTTGKVKITANGINELIAFNNSFESPIALGTIENQNLHALRNRPLIIITVEDFLPIANDIAQMHVQLDGTTSHIVTTNQIYNEFGSGSPDIAAIRNFLRMFYERATTSEDVPENVLLIGAASYDYKNRINNNTNFVPNYQSYNSGNFGASHSSSYSTDDYFVLLDSAEILKREYTSLYDMGIGRIPIVTLEEGNAIVNKIRNYLSPNSFGPWKNSTLFFTDDGDGAGNFVKQSDEMVDVLSNTSPQLNHNKLYADAYEKVPGASGDTYPNVANELNSQMFLGNLMVNYAGHGNPERLSRENILTKAQIHTYTNFNKLPVIITGTCDFGRYDNPSVESGGKLLFIKPDGGSIASLTTTQQVFSFESTNMITSYMANQFNKNEDGSINSMGWAIMHAKNENQGSSANNLKYVLLGDPALKIALPKLNVKTDSLKVYVSEDELKRTDTISALGSYYLYGSIRDAHGNVSEDFNGTVYITIYDKPQYNDLLSSSYHYANYKKYKTQNSIIYKGQVTVENGKFAIRMLIPKDLNYELGKGKVSYYAHNNVVDATGFDTNVVVVGFAEYFIEDNAPPVVNVFIDDEKFRDGGVTGPDPMLFVKIYDDNGINVSGSSVGHDLIAILDNNVTSPYILNNYYFTTAGDPREGTVHFPLSALNEGWHEVEVRAWDIYNNPGSGKVNFLVKDKSIAFISEVYNYPNPLVESTTNFVIQHNLKHVPVDITLNIYDSKGALVKQIVRNLSAEVNRLEIQWDGRGEGGAALPKGVYPYQVQIKSDSVETSAYNKMVIVR